MIEEWIVLNGGIGRLADRSGVSVHTILRMKNRQNPLAPKKSVTRRLLAKAMGAEENELFPLVNEEGRAS